MIDREKIIKGMNYCTHTDGVECPNCPYWQDDDCVETLNADAIALIKEQTAIIEQYRRTDGFLAAHGWKWEDGEVNG